MCRIKPYRNRNLIRGQAATAYPFGAHTQFLSRFFQSARKCLRHSSAPLGKAQHFKRNIYRYERYAASITIANTNTNTKTNFNKHEQFAVI